jgi:uncharacterized membrane protein YjfL (UPF0719 family)
LLFLVIFYTVFSLVTEEEEEEEVEVEVVDDVLLPSLG